MGTRAETASPAGRDAEDAPAPEGRALRIAYVWDRMLPTTATDAEQAVNTMSALARRGHRIVAVVPAPLRGETPSAQEVQAYYQAEGPFALRPLVEPFTRWIALRKPTHAARALRDPEVKGADVVYTRNAMTMTAATLAGLPVAYDSHRAWPDQLPFLRPLLRHVMGRRNFLGACLHSDYARQSYLRIGVAAEKLHVCRNGFDAKRFEAPTPRDEARRALALPLDRPIVTYTGHINASKGLLEVLDIAKRCPEATFLLVGSEGEGMVEKRARALANVQVLPWQRYDQVVQYLWASDVLLLPPSSAPLKVFGHTVLPMKVYQYLAAGRAIFGPATPDLEEVLATDENAVLVEPGNVQEAARALRELVNDPARMGRLGEAARATAEALTWDARAARIEGILRARLDA